MDTSAVRAITAKNHGIKDASTRQTVASSAVVKSSVAKSTQAR